MWVFSSNSEFHCILVIRLGEIKNGNGYRFPYLRIYGVQKLKIYGQSALPSSMQRDR